MQLNAFLRIVRMIKELFIQGFSVYLYFVYVHPEHCFIDIHSEDMLAFYPKREMWKDQTKKTVIFFNVNGWKSQMYSVWK